MRTDRQWTHDESPEMVPSAATYRLGCRCAECSEANRLYMQAYRAARVQHIERPDGTTQYHAHKGQPSKRTARAHLCIHPRCLDLAGLTLVEGVIRDKATGAIDATFGIVAAAVGAPTVELTVTKAVA